MFALAILIMEKSTMEEEITFNDNAGNMQK